MTSTKRKSTPSASESAAPPPKKSALASIFTKAPPPLLKNNPLTSLWPTELAQSVLISTWNVNGLKSADSKEKEHAFRKYVEAEKPDILILTEVNYDQASSDEKLHYLRSHFPGGRYWSKKTAALCKIKPLTTPVFGLPDWAETDQEESRARVVTLEYETVYIVGLYAQNSGKDKMFMSKKQKWNVDLTRYFNVLQEKKPVIFTGDFNAVTSRLDLEEPNKNWDQLPGAHKVERDEHEKLLKDCDLVDVWRELNPHKKDFSHKSFKFGGWRIDGFIVSRSLLYPPSSSSTPTRILSCSIRHDVHKHFATSSDHWPVVLSLAGPL